MSARSLSTIVAVSILSLVSDGWSQATTGTVTGVVRDAQSQTPVSAAQVHIPELAVGTLTQANGRYLLVNVPAGTHVIRVERIGYRLESQEVTVTAGQSAEANFNLTEDALALDEIVVTGTAGQARRREVGNQISQLRVDDVPEPVASVDQLLQGRVAGLRLVEGAGNSGSGGDIRLRGNVSAAMSNNPLIYVDGVRVKSDPYSSNSQRFNMEYFMSLGGSLTGASPLSDINPDDIERIEIVKGPAATTLYGTEAAAGVIQVFTKKGRAGAPVWTAGIRQGAAYFRPWGTKEQPYMYLDPVIRTGHRQSYELSVRGGTQQMGYFLASSYEDNVGAILNDGEKAFGVRGNVSFRPTQNLLLDFNNSLTSRSISNIYQGNSFDGVVVTAYRGPQSYVGDREPETLRGLVLGRGSDVDVNRYITGLTAYYTPTSSFTHRVTLGYDFADWQGRRHTDFGFRNQPNFFKGHLVRESSATQLFSFDYVGTLAFDLLGSQTRSTFSWGLQGVEELKETVLAAGAEFPGPGDYTISTASIRQASQIGETRVITGGFFAQNVLALRDRYFLTLGLRVDGNSAFGEQFGLQPYPKVSFSHVISDESFWPEVLGTMKLRAAYGHAGRAPGAFDAIRTWNAIGIGGRPAYVPLNIGNPELGPERTAEVELGFDGSWLGDRLTADFTYYHRRTSDALFSVRNPASEGGWASQLQNVGELENKGIELSLQASVLDAQSLGWDVGFTVATNQSKTISLGGAPSFSVGNEGWIVEGQPVPVMKGDRILNRMEKADPIRENDLWLGPAHPPTSITGNTSIRLPGGLLASARGEYNGGFYVHRSGEWSVLTRTIPFATCHEAYAKRDSGRQADLYAWERADCFGAIRGRGQMVSPGDYFELRELSLAVPVSGLLPRLVGRWRTDLTLSWRNVWYWKHEELMVGHPEMVSAPDGHSLTKRIDETFPPPSTVTVQFRVVF